MTDITYFLVVSQRTAFFKFNDIFPECSLYQEQAPKLEPLLCLQEDACHVGKNCMDTLAKRLKALFDLLGGTELILLYFKKRNVPGLGAGVFWGDFKTPRWITMNPKAWNQLKLRGDVFQFQPEPSFFLSGQTAEPELETPAHTGEEQKNVTLG